MASILSHGERRVAELYADGTSIEAIADERGVPVETVEKSLDRVREKTDRAYETLLESPFAAEAAANLSAAERERLLAALSEE